MKYVCEVCGWVYDEEETGVKWEDLPEDFECELCGVGKDQFSPAEQQTKNSPIFRAVFLWVYYEYDKADDTYQGKYSSAYSCCDEIEIGRVGSGIAFPALFELVYRVWRYEHYKSDYDNKNAADYVHINAPLVFQRF